MRTMTQDRRERVLRCLEGRELDVVAFVRDYVQLRFEGPLLNVYVWPVIIVNNEMYSLGMQGYRDQLCARIGFKVKSAEETSEYLMLLFTDKSSIKISLRDEDRLGPEAVLLDDAAAQVWNVW